MKEAISETVAQAIDDRMGTNDHEKAEEHANAFRQLSNENTSQRQEIAHLAKAVLVLSKEIRELKLAGGGA